MKTFPAPFLVRLLVLAALAGAFAPPAAAGSNEQKIATIDLKKVFDEFFRTKIEDGKIKEEAAGLDKARKELTDLAQKAIEDYKKAIEDANNQAISQEEREKRKKAAETKLVEVNGLEQEIKQFDRTARGNLEERQTRAREKILKDIQGVVNARAKAGGYAFVLDTAAEGMARTAVVFYTSGADDLTAAVLKDLNEKAPADLPKPDKNGKPEEKK